MRAARILRAMVLLSTALSSPAIASEFAPTIELSSMDGSNGFRIDGLAAGDYSGKAATTAGDVNGDGIDDMIIGAPWDGVTAPSHAGKSYVVFGRTSGFQSTLDLAALDGTNGFCIQGSKIGAASGFSASTAGDINGDGFSDIIVGAPQANPGGIHYAGSSYVVFGKPDGFAATLDVSALNGTNGFRIDGFVEGGGSGARVAAAGDVNGDGFGDMIVGAPTFVSGEGSVHVLFGKRTGFAPTINLSTLNGTTGFRFDGYAGDGTGWTAAAAGDFDGDGFSDVIIGARDAGQYASGESYVVFGKAAGFVSPLNRFQLDGTNGFVAAGIVGGDKIGYSVAGAGDVNGDGFDDVVIGAPRTYPFGGFRLPGRSYVVFGTNASIPRTIELSGLDGSSGFRIDGSDNVFTSGFAVAPAGDINSDGFADLLTSMGRDFVIFGKQQIFDPVIGLSSLVDGLAGFRIDRSNLDTSIRDAHSGAGDINGDGFSDIIIGIPQSAPGGLTNAGSTFVMFGRAPDAVANRIGASANQFISGGGFNDLLSGQGGRDELEGRQGGDALSGDAGSDAASYRHGVAGVTADLALPGNNTGEAAGDTYMSIENIVGTRFGDILRGNNLANVLEGGGGSDRLVGRNGADRFKFRRLSDSPPGAGRDRIIGFDAGDAGTSVDRIDLSVIDTRSDVAGNQAFKFITTPFTGTSGELRVRPSVSGSDAIVEGDVNGDGAADIQIVLRNFSNFAGLTSIDFIR